MSGDFTGHDMAQAREDGYSAGVQLATEYEHILTDLLAELRDAGRDQAMEESVIDLTELADTYEQRLREVQGE